MTPDIAIIGAGAVMLITTSEPNFARTPNEK